MPYATDADLQLLRPDILNLGPTSWSFQHEEAARLIDRALVAGWYGRAARLRGIDPVRVPFNPQHLLHADTQLTQLAAAKALHLAYLYLAKGHPDEPYQHLALTWNDRYRDELSEVVAAGLDYDWDGSATIDATESGRRQEPPTLERL